MALLRDLRPLPGQRLVDPRFRKITVHDLLFHGGGLPHNVRLPGRVKPEEGTESEEQVQLQYRWLLSQPLKFDPGTQHAYSNAGFVVLRLVVERVAGQEYGSFIKQHVLKPMGITRMRLEEPGDYRPDETHSYNVGGRQPAVRNVANWLATATSLARFAAAVAGSGSPFLAEKVTVLCRAAAFTQSAARPARRLGVGHGTAVPPRLSLLEERRKARRAGLAGASTVRNRLRLPLQHVGPQGRPETDGRSTKIALRGVREQPRRHSMMPRGRSSPLSRDFQAAISSLCLDADGPQKKLGERSTRFN